MDLLTLMSFIFVGLFFTGLLLFIFMMAFPFFMALACVAVVVTFLCALKRVLDYTTDPKGVL